MVKAPEIDAVPPTSNLVSMLPPELMPTLPASWETREPIVVVASVMVKVKPAEAMVVLASRVSESTNSSKSRELEVACRTVTQERDPEPSVWKNWLDEPSLPGQV